MSTSRNDPCPCGSGLKYKKCCLLKGQPSPDEFKRKRWGALQNGLIKKLTSFINEGFYEGAIQDAWDEFYCFEKNESFDPHSRELPLFMPWFFYEWYPEEGEELPLAKLLLKSRKNLTADEKAYLQVCCETSFSFHEVMAAVPGTSLTLKDILTEKQIIVLEKSASGVVRPGDIIFGKVIEIDGIGVLEACSSIIIRPDLKLHLLKFRKWIQERDEVINDKVLHEFYFEIIEQYQDIFNLIMNPSKPVLANTDGHLLIPHKLIYEIENPNETFEALHGLCIKSSKEELLKNASFNEKGEIESIEFPWLKKGNKKNKGWDNTVMGQIKITASKMTVEVNSKERASQFKTKLKKLMPSGHKLQSTLIESIESASKNMNPVPPVSNDELMNNPEVIAHMEKMMKAHWDDWINHPLPALGGLSPVDAAKDKEGREALMALITQFERDAANRPMPGQNMETFKELRGRLGLSS